MKNKDGTLLLDLQSDIAKAISKYTPLSAGQILYVMQSADSLDQAITAIDVGLTRAVNPSSILTAARTAAANIPFIDKNKARLDWLAKQEVEVRSYYGSLCINYVAGSRDAKEHSLEDQIDEQIKLDAARPTKEQ